MAIELSMEEILKKLYHLPEEFELAYSGGKWAMAASIYVIAVDVSAALDMHQEERMQYLYGFNQGKVEEAFEKAGWCEEELDERHKRSGTMVVRPNRHVQTSHEEKRLSVSSSVCRQNSASRIVCGAGREEPRSAIREPAGRR